MKITTIVVRGDLHQEINLSKLIAIGEQYRRTKSQGFLKFKDKLTASIYHTGIVQIFGIKKVSEIELVWTEFLETIKDYIDILKPDKPVLKFMVALEELPYKTDLCLLSHSLQSENIEYEPEQFPGLIWRTGNGTALVFSSGKIVITGCNSETNVLSCISYIRDKTDKIFHKF